MAERQPDTDLERALAELGGHVAYPPTPDLASGVRARLASGTAIPGWRWHGLLPGGRRWRALSGIVAVLLVAAAVVAAWPEARMAIAERLGLHSAPIGQVPALPSQTTRAVGAALDLGEPTTLESAQSRLPVLLPGLPLLGQPDAIYFAAGPGDGRLSLVYGVRAGLPPTPETGVSLLLLEARAARGGFDPIVLRKSAGPATRLEELSVNGGRGVWLEGAPHLLLLPDAGGQFREEPVRLAANVLLWEQNGLLVRLEGGLSRDQALEIAASVR